MPLKARGGAFSARKSSLVTPKETLLLLALLCPIFSSCAAVKPGQRSQASQNPPRKSLAPSGPPDTRCFFLLLALRLPSSRFSPHHPRPRLALRPERPSRRIALAALTSCLPGSVARARRAPAPCRTPPGGLRAHPDLQRSPGDVGGPGSEVGAAAAAAGRGRCAFKVPPPRGRETACASPIPPGSARDEKHNA